MAPRLCRDAARRLSECGADPTLTLKPEPALDYIAKGFDRYPVVALSELHGNRESAALLATLIRHDGFSRSVNDIVIEFGNAGCQPVVDRYISGAPVGRDELRGVWENTTQISGIWRLPMYEGILDDRRLAGVSYERECNHAGVPRNARCGLTTPPTIKRRTAASRL